jgi:hypothetical protein
MYDSTRDQDTGKHDRHESHGPRPETSLGAGRVVLRMRAQMFLRPQATSVARTAVRRAAARRRGAWLVIGHDSIL